MKYIKIGQLRMKDKKLDITIHKYPIYKKTNINYIYLTNNHPRLPLLDNDSEIRITNHLNYYLHKYEVYSVGATDEQIIETLCRHYKMDIKLKMQEYLDIYDTYGSKVYINWYKHEETRLKKFTSLQKDYMKKFKENA